MTTFRRVLLRMRNVLHKSCTENQNTKLFYVQYFYFLNHAVYEAKWENIVEPDRPQGMRIPR